MAETDHSKDAFICHASEDKDGVARPLAGALSEAGLAVWYDETSLSVGDSLREAIDEGLRTSRYGIVVFSPRFFEKGWPQKELNALFSREVAGEKVILPVWYDIGAEEMRSLSPLLSDMVAARMDDGLDAVAEQLLRRIKPGHVYKVVAGRTLSVEPAEVRLHSGDWSVTTDLFLCNPTRQPLYGVTLRLDIEGQGVDGASVQLTIEDVKGDKAHGLGGAHVITEYARIDGRRENGSAAIILFFTCIRPETRRSIRVTGLTAAKSRAKVQLLGGQTEPMSILKQNDKVAMPLKLTHGFSVENLTFYGPDQK